MLLRTPHYFSLFRTAGVGGGRVFEAGPEITRHIPDKTDRHRLARWPYQRVGSMGCAACRDEQAGRRSARKPDSGDAAADSPHCGRRLRRCGALSEASGLRRKGAGQLSRDSETRLAALTRQLESAKFDVDALSRVQPPASRPARPRSCRGAVAHEPRRRRGGDLSRRAGTRSNGYATMSGPARPAISRAKREAAQRNRAREMPGREPHEKRNE